MIGSGRGPVTLNMFYVFSDCSHLKFSLGAISFPLFRFLFCETVTHAMSFLVAAAALGIREVTLFR